MRDNLLCALALIFAMHVFSSNARATDRPIEFLACLKRTEPERATCQSGCGMILQQCYDEADQAISSHTAALLTKRRSPSCAELAKKYADGAAQLTDEVTSQSDAQPGWLSAELKMQLMQHRYASVKLIDDMCE